MVATRTETKVGASIDNFSLHVFRQTDMITIPVTISLTVKVDAERFVGRLDVGVNFAFLLANDECQQEILKIFLLARRKMLLPLLLSLSLFQTGAVKPTQFFDCQAQDFKQSSANPDFNKDSNKCSSWRSNALLKKAVTSTLQKNLPAYDTTTNAFTSKTMFDEWFAPSANSIAVPTNILMGWFPQLSMWQHSDMSFFPTAGQGHDGGIGTDSQNYFTIRCSSEFVYKGGEKIIWKGNDDFWLYVDGKILIDAGGIHHQDKSETTALLDTLGLTKGCRVTVRLFFAERCLASQSNFRIQTDMEPVRPGEAVGRNCGLDGGGGSVGDGGSGAITAANMTSDEEIEAKNKKNLETMGIILGAVFGFFVLWFLILFIVWLCRREHIKEQRLMHKMGGSSSKEVEMGQTGKSSGGNSSGGGSHSRNETYVGWTRMVDPNTGRTYYQNRMTGESRWADDLAPDNNLTSVVNPSHARSMTKEEKDLKFWGWEEHIDKATGVPFYHNSQTGETSWEQPTK